MKDGGYDSPRNAQVTWKMHLQQETEWEGNMFGKKDDFVGKEAFGEGERKPRELQRPGTFYEYNDVRINRLGLSLLRTFKKPVPEVFRDEVMDLIGASNAWKWVPYHNSYVDIDGTEAAVGERRHALGRRRVDQLVGHGALRLPVAARRQVGRASRSCRPPYVKAATHAERARSRLRLPLVAEHAGQELPGPADHRLRRARRGQQHHHDPARAATSSSCWRWHAGNEAEFVKRVIAAIK